MACKVPSNYLASIILIAILVNLSYSLAPPFVGDRPGYYCTESTRMLTRYFRPKDCTAAYNAFANDAVRRHGPIEYEFLPPSWSAPPTALQFRTPLRWSSGTCTLAVVTMSAFLPGEVPELPEIRRYRESDVVSFEEMDFWIKRAKDRCLPRLAAAKEMGENVTIKREVEFTTSTGFAVTGKKRGVAVFLWDTASVFNARRYDISSSLLNDTAEIDDL